MQKPRIVAEFVGILFAMFLEPFVEIIPLAIQPAFALNEVEEQKAVEQCLRFFLDDVFFPIIVSANVFRDRGKDFAKVVEEFLRDRFNVEGFIMSILDSEWRRMC